MEKNKWLLIILIGLTSAACSTAHKRVMSTAEGANKIVIDDIEREKAEDEAFKSAQKYCKDKQVVILNEKTEYRGTIDEKQRNLIRKASKTAWGLSKIGSPVATAGKAGQMMTSDRDYHTEITFKCQ